MELVEAAKALKRFCDARKECNGCPLESDDCECGGVLITYPEKVEEVITEWLKDNPEPKRLTWGEWLNMFFPEGYTTAFCPKSFVGRECPIAYQCPDCLSDIPPDDIAEKLNIPFKEKK